MRKLYEFQTSLSSESKSKLKELENLFVEFDSTGDQKKLIRAQEILVGMEAKIADAIRATNPPRSAASASGGTAVATQIDTNKAPKPAVFVFNLARRYPQNEQKYFELWYKAAERSLRPGQTTYNYGAVMNIFKTYCKRETLALEGVDHTAEELQMIEEYNNSLQTEVPAKPAGRLTRFEDFKFGE